MDRDAPQTEQPDHDAFVKAINFRYLKTFGNVTLITLVVWLGVMGGGVATMGFGWPLVLVGIGTGLIALFAMRTVVHLRGTLLADEVEAYAEEQELTLEALIGAAKQLSPPADFFVSLVDGPLARHRRESRAKTRPPQGP